MLNHRSYTISSCPIRFWLMRMLLPVCLSLIYAIHSPARDKLFATLENNSIKIVYDTAKFKSEVSNIAFSDYKPKPVFESVCVMERTVVGDLGNSYFAVLLTDTSGTIKVAKWLEKRGSELYIIDLFKNDNRLQAYYFTCIGNDGCTPSVLSVDGVLGWSCSEVAACSRSENCRIQKAILVN